MRVVKKLNNNVVICRDNNQRELIAFGKGIGFPKVPYELTDLKKVERTFYNVSEQYISLLNDIPYEIIQFTAGQILAVQDELPYEMNANLVLTLADHIAFAIERAQKGIFVRMPSVYELELGYPLEVKIGKDFVAAVKKQFRVALPKSEVQGIAMHLINARERSRGGEDVPNVEQFYEEILKKTAKIIGQELKVRVRKDTFNYGRFEEQKKAVRSGYDMEIIPTDLATYGEEAKNLLQDLQSRNERMFLVTVLVENIASKRQKLFNDIFAASGVAQKYNYALKRLDYQQEQGLMSSLALGVNQIEIERGLTTSSTAIFVPFTTCELFQEGEALYYGLNALSNNLIMANRKTLKNPNGLFLGTPGSGKSYGYDEYLYPFWI